MSNLQAASSGSMCACMAFVFLLFATCTPWMLYGCYANPSYSCYGVGPFVAGYQTSMYPWRSYNYWSSIVWWSSLNTQNACTGDIAAAWSIPNGLCPGGSFATPPQAIGIQACVILATIFSFFACILGSTVRSSQSKGGIAIALCASIVSMAFSAATFALYTTWPMSTKLQNQGDFIPLWAVPSSAPNSAAVIVPSPFPVKMIYGWTYIMGWFCFVFMVVATAMFSFLVRVLHAEHEDEGTFASGMPGASY